jgi:hypothetical protein
LSVDKICLRTKDYMGDGSLFISLMPTSSIGRWLRSASVFPVQSYVPGADLQYAFQKAWKYPADLTPFLRLG